MAKVLVLHPDDAQRVVTKGELIATLRALGAPVDEALGSEPEPESASASAPASAVAVSSFSDSELDAEIARRKGGNA